MRGRLCCNSCRVRIRGEGVVVVEVEVVERRFVPWRVWRGRCLMGVVVVVAVVINLHHFNLLLTLSKQRRNQWWLLRRRSSNNNNRNILIQSLNS
jgi:hypothetical protein